jgi:hypothetical protein
MSAFGPLSDQASSSGEQNACDGCPDHDADILNVVPDQHALDARYLVILELLNSAPHCNTNYWFWVRPRLSEHRAISMTYRSASSIATTMESRQ